MSALDELLQALRGVQDRLGETSGDLARGRQSLDEVRAALVALDPRHPETVVPPGLDQADDQIARVMELVERCGELLEEFAARL